MANSYSSLIPEQYTGEETETSSQTRLDNKEAAKQLFQTAVSKLVQVNNWKKWCGELSSDFRLIDTSGSPVEGNAKVGQYMRIDIPGPGTKAGDGYDWVFIEQLEYVPVSEEEEIQIMTARPSEPPGKDETAHFLTDEATSSFIVHRRDLLVQATVIGRNELPNTDSSGFTDKLRNAVVGASGAAGISKLQWKALTAALVEL